MAGSQMNVEPKAIGCETCERMAWDDGRWNKWTEADPNGKTYHVCHNCLSSPRSYWKDLFSLCQKADVGKVHLPHGLQSTASDSLEMCIASQQQPGDVSGEKHYERFEDPFEHSPLNHDQIRLLSLLPGRHDLFCIIEEATINLAGADYEALSYCWGDNDQPKHTIWINGHPFETLSNLYAALMQLRKPNSTRKLWIDAICINQVGYKGKAEKSVQIPLMGRIYHQAARVIVWLGPEKDDSDEVLDIINEQNVKAMRTRKFAMDFGRLLKRPWYRRTWIVQEFVLGKALPQILCGSRVVSYGKFMATHWVLPELVNGSPDMEFDRTLRSVDSNGNLKASQTFRRKITFAYNNHDEAEETLAELINIRRAALDDESRLRLRPLYKILPFVKAFGATDLKDKIYGVFGVASPSVHQYVQVNYQKSIAEVYRDAMTYMLRQGQEEPGVLDMYLEYPLSLSLDVPTPRLPSWVPDFSRNSAFLRNHEDSTWHWQYHQSSGPGGHKALLSKQHGRHRVARETVDRQLISVDDAALTVRGFLIDEVDMVIESQFLCGDDDMREYSERHTKSSSKARQSEARDIKNWLDDNEKTKDHTVTEITTRADDIAPFLASTLKQRYRTNNLYEINELCREKLLSAGRDLDSESWLTFIWRDLLAGYSALVNMSEEEFDEQFYDLAGSEKAITGETWVLDSVRNEVRSVNGMPQLNIPMRELFKPSRSFFTTAMSGFYGISPPGVREGDKLAFLFPQVYMAFILRPSGSNYQMLGPCLVPPHLRDRFLESHHSRTREEDFFEIT